MADIVSALHRESPTSRIILAGHSMGGGIAMRYAERHAARRDVPDVDGYLPIRRPISTRTERRSRSRCTCPASSGS